MKTEQEFSNLFKKDEKHKKYNDINSFIKIIPHMEKYRLNSGFDIFKFIEEKQIPAIIENYFILAKDALKDKNLGIEIKFDDTINKILLSILLLRFL